MFHGFQFAFSLDEGLNKQLITDFKKNPPKNKARTKTKNATNKISSR